MAESLKAKFDALHAQRERDWEPAQLQRNIDTRRKLVEAFDPATVVRVGDHVEPVSLELADGLEIDLSELTADGPVALVFFRFAGCPACNIALPHYDETLRPALDAAGVRLIAVSPHLPERGLGEIALRHQLGFDVASDRGNRLARRFGLTFTPSDGGDTIGQLTGLGTGELPQPAVILIDEQRIVRFVDISPDWLVRTEASTVLDALEGYRALRYA